MYTHSPRVRSPEYRDNLANSRIMYNVATNNNNLSVPDPAGNWAEPNPHVPYLPSSIRSHEGLVDAVASYNSSPTRNLGPPVAIDRGTNL